MYIVEFKFEQQEERETESNRRKRERYIGRKGRERDREGGSERLGR